VKLKIAGFGTLQALQSGVVTEINTGNSGCIFVLFFSAIPELTLTSDPTGPSNRLSLHNTVSLQNATQKRLDISRSENITPRLL
jgi:hypothetical protein